jgi:hypothetical protein
MVTRHPRLNLKLMVMTVKVDNTLFLDWIYFSITTHFLPKCCSLQSTLLGTYCNVPSDHTTISSEILMSKRSGVSLNLLPFNATFTSGKGKKSYGTEFGEYRGCSYPELYRQTNQSAVSWWRNQSLQFHFSPCFHNVFSCRCYKMSM